VEHGVASLDGFFIQDTTEAPRNQGNPVEESIKRCLTWSVCKISGKMKLATTIFVVAFDMQKTKEKPRARRGEDHLL
jgi:hypothetical protein